MAFERGNGQDGEILTWTENQDIPNDDNLQPHLTFYGSGAQLQVTTPPFQLPPTAEQLDHIYRPHKLLQARSLDPHNNTYLETFVLLLSWEDEDPRLPVRSEIDRLQDVFQRLYHFKVERWSIPSKDPHIRLNEKILALVRHGDDRKDCLKIVYYGGHGKLTRNRQSMWTDHRGRSLVWAGIQNALEQANSDALILIDSCGSGTANTDEGSGVTELVAAGGFNTTANGVGPWSFTHALEAELRLLSNGRPFTVAKLHNRILSRMQNQIPDGQEYHDPFEIQPIERFVTPVHVVLTEDKSSISRRIQLRRNERIFIPHPKPTEENALDLDLANMPSSRPPTPLPTLSISKLNCIEIEPSVSRPSSTFPWPTTNGTNARNVVFAQKGKHVSKGLMSAWSLQFEVDEILGQIIDLLMTGSTCAPKRPPRKVPDLRVNGTYDEFLQLQRQILSQMSEHYKLLLVMRDRIAFDTEQDIESNSPKRKMLWIDRLVERTPKKFQPRPRQRSIAYIYSEDYVPKHVHNKALSIVLLHTTLVLALATYFIWHIANPKPSHQTMLVVVSFGSFASNFAAFLSLFTRVDRYKILGATAAYCAVVVIFVANIVPSPILSILIGSVKTSITIDPAYIE